MKKLFLALRIFAFMLFYKSSLAQCPTGFYSSISTTSSGGNGFGTNSLSNPANMVDGNLTTFAFLTSNNTTPATPAVLSIDVTLNATIPANSFFYLKVNDVAGLTVQAYNGATPINAPDIVMTILPGATVFELKSTQPVTRVKVTFTNSAGLQTRQLYELYSGVQCANPMPVTLISFTAKAQGDRTVELAWTTSLETDNKSFRVERSKDLKRFETVGELSELAPASNALKTYQLTDQMPYAGTSYYRLTQTDLNGKETVYPAVSVVLRNEAYGVFPNPVVSDGRFALRVDEPETATVGFYSADGRVLPLQQTGIESGNLRLKAPANLSTGVYLLRVEERGQTRQHRLIVE